MHATPISHLDESWKGKAYLVSFELVHGHFKELRIRDPDSAEDQVLSKQLQQSKTKRQSGEQIVDGNGTMTIHPCSTRENMCGVDIIQSKTGRVFA